MFDNLPNKSIVISKVKDVPDSASLAKIRIIDMAIDVKELQTVALKIANSFSIPLHKSVGINNISRLAIVAKNWFNRVAHEE